jgi:aryl-alcohol dehydrogenase-like predicted oxidoreductase
VIPYSPLAGGFLTGKYRRGAPAPKSQRAGRIEQQYVNERGYGVIEALESVASAHSTTVAAVALAWLLAQPGVTAPIIGANTPAQLADLLPASHLRLTAEEAVRLDAVSDGF